MNATETPGTSASASAIAPPTHALLMTIDRRSAYRGWDGSARKRRDVPTRSSERIPSATRLSASCCTELGLTPIMRAASRSPTVRSGSARSRASSLARVRDPKSRSSAMRGAYNGVGRMSNGMGRCGAGAGTCVAALPDPNGRLRARLGPGSESPAHRTCMRVTRIGGSAVRSNVVLIDFENVQPASLQALEHERYRVVVFVGATQVRLPFEIVSAIQRMGDRAEYVRISGTGPNALDFHIAFY